VTDPPRRVVYTALIGGYEELLDQPVARGSSLDFVCLTDQPSLRSDDWEVRLIEPVLLADRIRSARAVKITGHPSLATYDESLWIDNRVRLDGDPGELLDEWLDGHEIAVPRHSYRADVVSEFQAVLDQGLDDSSRLYEQLTHYSALQPELLRHPVPWTGMLARRRTPEVDAAMERWLRHVLRYSRRDQLSFVQSMHEAGVGWSSIDLANFSTHLHEWRLPVGRSTRPIAFQVADSLQPPTAALGELRLTFERTVDDLTAAVQSREQTIAELEADLERGHQAIARAVQENAELHEARAGDQAALRRLRRRVRKVRTNKRRVERELVRASAPWRPWRRPRA
jgi:hypothetical protein